MFSTSCFQLQLYLMFEEIRANFHFAPVAAAYYAHFSQMFIHFFFCHYEFLVLYRVSMHGKMYFIGCLKKLKTYDTCWSDTEFNTVLAGFFWIAHCLHVHTLYSVTSLCSVQPHYGHRWSHHLCHITWWNFRVNNEPENVSWRLNMLFVCNLIGMPSLNLFSFLQLVLVWSHLH